MASLIGFLVLFPLLIAVILLLARGEIARRVIVCSSGVIIGVGSVWLVLANLGASWTPIAFSSSIVDMVCTIVGVLIAVVILYHGVRYKNVLACVLALVQVAGSLAFDILYVPGAEVENALYLDSLSLLMAFIIGVVGSGICIYALGYMEDFQAHEPSGSKDRRPTFFALMFLFLSAMFLIVFSDNMLWMFTGWEITTVCSFLLIGFTRTEEAIRNAFRQIVMNLAGGIGFLAALYFVRIDFGTLSLVDFLSHAAYSPALASIPACALAFAGLTKAAQMPFHTWLLGAMVAPTPTSALLHSSTMVKAGVFLLIKLAPVYLVCPAPAVMTVLVGALTFMLCSFIAISQSNAKRVLAYSTIANLGLIVACAGVGTPEAIWAAAFLVLFHAIAKSLLFLCVGTAEHHIGSRDIEDMDLLFERMPRLARYMMAGIMVMFVAPFGMLIAKWGTLVSFTYTGNAALILILGFGSAATFLFWAKWLGKLAGIAARPLNVETTVHRSEWLSLMLMAVLCILCCIGIPAISRFVVEPYLSDVFATPMVTVGEDNLWISAILAFVVFVVMFGGLGRRHVKRVPVYLSGVSANNDERTFRNSLSGETQATARNWYLEEIFGEGRIKPVGEIACTTIIVLGFALSAATMAGML